MAVYHGEVGREATTQKIYAMSLTFAGEGIAEEDLKSKAAPAGEDSKPDTAGAAASAVDADAADES